MFIKNFVERYRFFSILILIIAIFLIIAYDIMHSKILVTLIVDDSTGDIDKSIFWNALGSISTTLAVLIALFQYSMQNRKRIKLSFNQSTIVGPGFSGDKFLVLTIANVGLRTINIQSWRFILKGKIHYLTFPISPYGQTIEFPISVATEESYDLYFSLENFKNLMRKGFDLNKKMTMYVTDSVGSRYYLKTTGKIKDYLD